MKRVLILNWWIIKRRSDHVSLRTAPVAPKLAKGKRKSQPEKGHQAKSHPERKRRAQNNEVQAGVDE
jgi:hypothetical protein